MLLASKISFYLRLFDKTLEIADENLDALDLYDWLQLNF